MRVGTSDAADAGTPIGEGHGGWLKASHDGAGEPLLGHLDLAAPAAWQAGQALSAARLLADAQALAARLPPRGAVINLCTDRYRFAVGLLAALLRRQVSLLPPSGSGAALEELAQCYPETYCLVDGASQVSGLPLVVWSGAAADDPLPSSSPLIPADQLAVIAFTSGSTGDPQPHPKCWGTLMAGARLTGQRLGLDPQQAGAVLATVPPQHMYGLELSVLLPLVWGYALCAERPFFPADVSAALTTLPAGALLVTTPFHIRALLEEGADMAPPPRLLLSATAPLPSAQAQRAEQEFRAPLLEIYGSTETGAIATRRSALGAQWQTLAGITLQRRGGQVWVEGGHLEGAATLNDEVELIDEGEFTLLGRRGDLLNIAGKRLSLGELTGRLLALSGVEDAAVLVPEAGCERVERIAAVVVAPGRSAAELLAELRGQIDPVFLPRPLKLVAALPRSATGKLPRAALLRLLGEP